MAKKNTVVPRSPLTGCEAISRDDYQQVEVFPLGKIILRGKSGDSGFTTAIKNTLKCELPLTPNTTTCNGNTRLLWLGPEEWLLWVKSQAVKKQLVLLQKALSGQHAAVINVSDYYTIIRLGGEKAAQVLAHGCPLDMRDKRFGVGGCAQSHYRNAAILLYRTDDGYDVQVRWSFAQYLWHYFSQVSMQ